VEIDPYSCEVLINAASSGGRRNRTSEAPEKHLSGNATIRPCDCWEVESEGNFRVGALKSLNHFDVHNRE